LLSLDVFEHIAQSKCHSFAIGLEAFGDFNRSEQVPVNLDAVAPFWHVSVLFRFEGSDLLKPFDKSCHERSHGRRVAQFFKHPVAMFYQIFGGLDAPHQ
jgi:hypothetical protein